MKQKKFIEPRADVEVCFVFASSSDFMLLSIVDLMWRRN